MNLEAFNIAGGIGQLQVLWCQHRLLDWHETLSPWYTPEYPYVDKSKGILRSLDEVDRRSDSDATIHLGQRKYFGKLRILPEFKYPN